MNEKVTLYMKPMKEFWSKRTKGQKLSMVIGVLSVLAIAGIATYFMTRVTFVPLYSNLSPAETGQIKTELDSRGIKSEISNDGKTISVPSNVENSLKVDLASKGIPNSGTIDYSSFGNSGSISLTDNEFSMMKLESTQNEIANLMKGIDGIEDAKVMITLPKESVWVNDTTQESSASIVLKTKPGYQFEQNQINALYHLVSKSVPNLPTDNIVITNQNFEYYDLKNGGNNSSENVYLSQQAIKKEIEKDIQRQIQQILGTVMGPDKIVTTVTADVDFTQENSEVQLVEPVDKDKTQGIVVSAEKIKETYTGAGEKPGGVAGTGQTDIPSYQSGSNQNGESTKTEERINYEVNKIKKTITESPYKVRDIGIGVMVEPPNANDPNSLPPQTINDIKQMLGTIVQSSINKGGNGTALTQDQLNEKIVVSVQKFNGKQDVVTPQTKAIPLWIYIVAGVLVLIIAGLVFMLLRRNKKAKEVVVEDVILGDLNSDESEIDILQSDDSSESAQKRKQLERIAKDRPEEFAKLLRTWLSEE